MQKYSHDILANSFDKDRWNGHPHYLICPNYNGTYCSLTMEMFSRPFDEFYLIYDTNNGEMKTAKSSVSVDFTPNSTLWEGAYTMLQAIIASEKPIADDIMKAIKLGETKNFGVDLKEILEPDEEDIAEYDPEEIAEYYGKYVIHINPNTEE